MRVTVKTGLVSRSSRILGMAARIGGHEMRLGMRKRFQASKERLARSELKTRIAQATALAEGLSELKGAAMKAGQLLSIDASDVLPEEATRILSKLQGDAEPMPFDAVRAVLDEELGDQVARLEGLEEHAAASASIGQVHRARVDGRPVAVKIQYPGIRASIDSDMKMLATLAESWLAVSRRRIDVASTFDEMRSLLHLEADYRRELALMTEVGERIADDPRFVVPRAYPALSGERVLTMSWEQGRPLAAWIQSGPSLVARERLARAVLDLYCQEFFAWGLVQTDPNHGNFLVRDDGRIVLLDFGATLRYDARFRSEYVHLLRSIASKDEDAVVQAGIDFGILDPREPEEPRRLFAAMLFSAMEPFEAHMQPFLFRDEGYAARARDIGQRFVHSLQFSPPPRKIIFLHRKLGGIFQLLRRLDLRLDLSPYWAKMVGGDDTPRTLQAAS